MSLSLALTGCSDGSATPVATYVNTEKGITTTFVFHDDGTYTYPDTEDEALSGTYTGSPTSDGTLTLHMEAIGVLSDDGDTFTTGKGESLQDDLHLYGHHQYV